MTDVDRITRITTLLVQAWLQNPELRLLQLLINCIKEECDSADLYYLTDTVLERDLRAYLDR